jgi:hypothetical protein
MTENKSSMVAHHRHGDGVAICWHRLVVNQLVTVPADTEIGSWASSGAGTASRKDGRMGTTDVRNVSSDNPLGRSPNPHGWTTL